MLRKRLFKRFPGYATHFYSHRRRGSHSLSACVSRVIVAIPAGAATRDQSRAGGRAGWGNARRCTLDRSLRGGQGQPAHGSRTQKLSPQVLRTVCAATVAPNEGDAKTRCKTLAFTTSLLRSQHLSLCIFKRFTIVSAFAFEKRCRGDATMQRKQTISNANAYVLHRRCIYAARCKKCNESEERKSANRRV